MLPVRVAPLLGLLVSLPLLSGCLSSGDSGDDLPVFGPVELSKVVAPKANISGVADGVLAVWKGPLELPTGLRLTIPANVTFVEARRVAASPAVVTSFSMVHAATERIRCQPEVFEAYFTRSLGEARCSGLAVLDPLPAVWKTGGLNLLDGERIEVLLRGGPLDGPAALIDLASLSMPDHEALATEYLTIPASTDGEKLWLEVTRPDVDGKVPTVIVSSPYNHATRAAGLRPQNSTIADWVPRGYAVVSADVRGFGESGGCVEVWGAKEQQDQVDVVQWVADQPWSDGAIGFYGQSYVATTPLEAASLGAPSLDAIIIVAPVVNAYADWHFGGVPNGESVGSPAGYQQIGTSAQTHEDDPLTSALNAANGVCDPALSARANDPRAVYDAFYAERDFARRAQDVKAAVLYTHGFYDENVKVSMVLDWFNALHVPKKAILGDWVHQHPVRADQELYFHAWLDQYVRGRPTGIDRTPVVEVRTNVDTVRFDDAWPSDATEDFALGLDLSASALADGAGSGSARFLVEPTHGHALEPTLLAAGLPASLILTSERLSERLYVSGEPRLALRATLSNAQNAFFYAELRDVPPEGEARVVTYGMLNAALRNTYERYEAVTPGAAVDYELPFLPTEYVVAAGHRLELTVRSADAQDWFATPPTEPATVTLDGAASALLLPAFADPGDAVAPASMGPVDPAALESPVGTGSSFH